MITTIGVSSIITTKSSLSFAKACDLNNERYRMELFKVLGKVLMVCFPAWRSVLFVGVISLCLSSPIAEKIKKKQSYHGERDERVASY